jgi:hypothetical protein
VTFGRSSRFGRLERLRLRPGRRCVLQGNHSGKAAAGEAMLSNQKRKSPIEARGADHARGLLFDDTADWNGESHG